MRVVTQFDFPAMGLSQETGTNVVPLSGLPLNEPAQLTATTRGDGHVAILEASRNGR